MSVDATSGGSGVARTTVGIASRTADTVADAFDATSPTEYVTVNLYVSPMRNARPRRSPSTTETFPRAFASASAASIAAGHGVSVSVTSAQKNRNRYRARDGVAGSVDASGSYDPDASRGNGAPF